MAGQYRKPNFGVRLSQEDHKREALEVIDWLYRAYQEQLRRQRRIQREYQRQLRHERNMRRAYERQLRRQRRIQREYQQQLRHERNMRRAYEGQLRRQRDYDGRPAAAATETHIDVLYGPKVAKLLDLAVCSDSDAEATAAFAKARALHRLTVLGPPETQESGTRGS